MKTFFLLLSLLPCTLHAMTKSPDLCPTLTGTWQGTYLDHGPYDGPVSTKMTFLYKGGDVYGSTLALPDGENSFGSFTVLGQCQHNQLILRLLPFYPNLCGPTSTGTIINNHQIKIDLKWENAMTGGYGPLTLTRVNDDYSGDTKIAVNKVDLSKILQSCH